VVQLVKDKTVTVEGVIIVSHDKDGNVTVVDTGDHVGRKGLGWGAGVGVVVGLFAPPLLASVVVGGAAGGLVGHFVDHKLKRVWLFWSDTRERVLMRAVPLPGRTVWH